MALSNLSDIINAGWKVYIGGITSGRGDKFNRLTDVILKTIVK